MKTQLFLKDDISFFSYEIWLTPETTNNARSYMKDGVNKIYIGMKGELRDVIESIMHEISELYLFSNNCRFVNTKLPSSFESSECIFMLSHTTFQQLFYYLSDKLYKILPNLTDKWKEFNIIKENKNE